MPEFIVAEKLAKHPDYWAWQDSVDLRQHIRVTQDGERSIAEFIGASSFATAFVTRQQYEVDAGRDEVPLLYGSFYNIVTDSNLPEFVDISVLGPGGVAFEEVKEGGEVKFSTISESTKTVQIKQYAAAIEYTKKLFMFNQTWQLAPVERWFGNAHNALMNHIHISPILTYSYASANQTPANSTGADLWEKTILTLEAAITASRTDTANPRRGPYDLLVSSADLFKIERALLRRVQDGIDVRTSAINLIQNVIAYDGWSTTRGKKEISYSGVTSGKAYLISKQFAGSDFQSWVKQPLQSQRGDGDLSRFIIEQVIYDVWLGTYTNPLRAVEEITLPT